MKESFEAPVRKARINNEYRESQERANKFNRDRKLNRVNEFARGKGLSVPPKNNLQMQEWVLLQY
ncbi:hypothetical protein SAMN03080617_00848 [Algoriphagus alkaliphilus]|uniref:Uncharacterized protein n=1 Tax=Algoriphagus alkaliphilus TaxID=279824 RepID=A0A1G5W1J8_9BACT|nr:hypothetical protein [Algoriphagus alkaliphilus]SDA52021.1 hypothetical protein SAMN03080617_00848 [Algoriphagus alkaliphilus]